ncbi:transcriptional regulator, LacI family [Verrucomicrobium sp. GAS474]|uniref:LacI family DNA-binding transcriptional regulator n=1 Tax=Verrucomicrobium sp. GAS474 TaxID=1882831 RepID=UPI00087A123A|nr:LacI family DNA-binding transcriptional regulator [Verrucomicrobium sp. GAS474]SDU27673.1 transcriptional regulator, LacI family [Verrucomicrobium sp. GAS474]
MARTRKKTDSSATMENVAKKLNLSVATVSRALRRVPGINAETRALVLQTASEVGYRLPRSYRSSTVGGKDRLQHIGVFMETTNGTQSHPYLTGLSDAAMSLNSSLVIHHVKPGECASVLDPAQQPTAMRSGLLSGVVLIFWWPSDVVRALSQKLPTVSIMHKYPGTDVDMVGLDNEGGMDLLVRELYAKGHRKIAFVGRCSQLHWSTARFGGYVAALASLGIEYRPDWVIDVDFDTLSSKEAGWEGYGEKVEKLRKAGITAWVCSTEPAGWMLHDWFTARGLRVPEDVSITGFHRPNQAESSRPDLTSVGASYEAIGAAALKRLQIRIKNPAESCRSILFPSDFYPGSTVGPVPSKAS